MAIVEITCPFCNSLQKIPEQRLAEPVMCLKCTQTIDEPFMHKVAPAQVKLSAALKGKLVTDFGTTELEEVESAADAYTGRKPTEVRAKDDLQALESAPSLTMGSGGYSAKTKTRVLSSAARTYVTGGVLIALVLVMVTLVGISLMEEETESKAIEINTGTDRLERYPNGTVKLQWSVTRLPTGEEVMHGKWAEFYDTGEKKALGQYVEGREDGLWETWFINGQVQSRGKYIAGVKDGLWEEFHFNGKTAAKATWVNGVQDGEARRWYADGKSESVTRYKNGVFDGDWSEWHENGELKFSNTYKAGRKVGNWRRFFDNGKQELEETFVDGLPEGTSWGAYRNGQREFEGTWKAGLQSGLWTWWHANGNKKKTGNYVEGRQDGQWTEWHENGQMRLRENYASGTRDGLWEEFWPDGSLATRREYVAGKAGADQYFFGGQEVLRRTEQSANGTLKAQWTVLAAATETMHGAYRSYHLDGKTVAEEGEYVNGRKNGLWRYFNAEGQQTMQRRFEDGNEVQ